MLAQLPFGVDEYIVSSMSATAQLASSKPSETLHRVIPFVPAGVLVAWTFFGLTWRYLLPRALKRNFDIISYDCVTLEHTTAADGMVPVPARLRLWKVVATVSIATFRLAIEVALLVLAKMGEIGYDVDNKLSLALHGTNVGVWALIATHSVFFHSPTPHYGLTLFFLLDALVSAYTLLTASAVQGVLLMTELSRLVPALLLLAIALSLPITALQPSPKTPSRHAPASRVFDSPEDGTTLWSWLLVDWMRPLLSLARKRTLDDEDVWQLSPFFQHHIIYPVFRDLQYSTLMRKLYAFTAFDLLITSLCSVVIAFLTFAGPYFLKGILEALDSTDPTVRSTGYNLALLAFALQILKAEVDLCRQWFARRSYERVRGALVTMVFDKATKRKDTSGSLGHRQKDDDEEDVAGADTGRILNFMNGDAYAIAQWYWEISTVIKAPIELVVAIVFLYQILGWSCLIGLSTVIFFMGLFKLLANRQFRLYKGLTAATDKRIAAISELVAAIRFLKYYAWEQFWVDKAIDAREKELTQRYWVNTNVALLTLLFTTTPNAIVFVTFWSFTKLAKQELTIPVAFSAMSALALIQSPLFELPGKVLFYFRTKVSVKRLERFLEEPERDVSIRDPQGFSTQSASRTNLAFKEATLMYPQHEVKDETVQPFKLRCPELSFPAGKLTIVHGANASGKSSLLMACLGEMDCIEGTLVRPPGQEAFAIATQDAWLEQATIRDNILFGSAYNEERFQAVIEACALSADLARFAAGENTEIGERGISLSGGQRARVALARAVYSNAAYVLLDDPLSAVDAHTARHLVDNCLGGSLMKSRTCILVTHHVKLCLPVASLSVKMVKGEAAVQAMEDAIADEDEDGKDAIKRSASVESIPKEQILTQGTATPVHGGLITKENRETGSVKWIVYKMYLKASGVETWIGILLALLAARGMMVVTTWFFKAWGESYKYHASRILPPASENVTPWLAVYAGLSILTAFIYLARLLFTFHGSFKAARKLLLACLLRVTNAPSRWLDENPTGRLLNRFTADIGSVDDTINNSVTGVASDAIGFVTALAAVVYVVPSFILFAAASGLLYISFATPYVRCSRDLRRLENNHRSPLFSRFGGLLRGLKVVRAFGQETRYLKQLMNDLDLFQSMDHFFWTARFYLTLRFDFVGALAIYVVTLTVLSGSVAQGSAAFAIVLAQQFVNALHATCWSYAKLELDVNSIERIHDLLSIPQEPPAIIESKRPPAHWPAKGAIHIEDLAIRYAPHLPLALKSVSVSIEPGQKIGIVGRTGSGKTTLALSLLRITEPAAGSITIDGIDIADIGLRDLRERVTIISQESTLFEGTIRSNLDPRNEHSDLDMWDVLRRVGMARSDSDAESDAHAVTSLDAPVNSGGENFSQGERQLLAIARALLRRTNVFIADEATASVDFVTDEKVQHTLRRELSGATVITIAHRLRTVIDVDRVLVLSEGVVREFGPPIALLDDPTSAFSELCRQSNEFDELRRLADAKQ